MQKRLLQAHYTIPNIFTDSEPPKKCQLGVPIRRLIDNSDPQGVKYFRKLLTYNIILVILCEHPAPQHLTPLDPYGGGGAMGGDGGA